MRLAELGAYLDSYLGVGNVPDYPGALNGVQVENSGEVVRLAVAVDAVQATIEGAIEDGANLLIVHHGLYWDGNQPLVGRRYRRIRRLLEADLAVYSCHLPLDGHAEVGNNAVLARELGIEVDEAFGEFKGYPLGVAGRVDLKREELHRRLSDLLGTPVRLVPGGPERIRRVGVISGGAGDSIAAALAAGLDAFVTGEVAHHHFFDAEEGGINLFVGGHYATEVWGVRALGGHLEDRFGLPWSFIDHPTGM